jgi:hypothetical protein
MYFNLGIESDYMEAALKYGASAEDALQSLTCF